MQKPDCTIGDYANFASGSCLHLHRIHETGTEVKPAVWISHLDILFGQRRAGTERRIHKHYIVSLLAEIDERKSPHRIFHEKLPLKALAILGLLCVITKSLNHLG